MIYNNVELYNITAIEDTGSALKLSRVPLSLHKTVTENASSMLFTPAGGEIRFNLVEGPVKITLRSEGPFVNVAEVWRGAFADSVHDIRGVPTEIIVEPRTNDKTLTTMFAQDSLAFHPELVRVILPYGWPCELISIEGETTCPVPAQSPVRRMLTYGSSITQGGNSVTPTGTYAARTASLLNVDLINLGMSGNARMDMSLAEYIATNPNWEFATIEMGINVLDWSVELFAEKVDAFVTNIATANPDKWIFCTGVYTCGGDYEENSKIHAFRKIVETQVQKLDQRKLVFVPPSEILPTAAGLTADTVHPSVIGHETMARNWARVIKSYIK
ncbi:MAG TPA: SGNH/GDSL hydrolase family protein [Capsulimonadaceae bacterium]|jgi:lysophospholipase L1-like esterase